MRKIALFFKILATGTFTMMLSACYGVVAVMYGVLAPIVATVKVRDATSKAPIAGIKVSYTYIPRGSELETIPQGDWAIAGHTTETTGMVDIENFEPGSDMVVGIKAEDLDGISNGGDYETKVVLVDTGSTAGIDEVVMDIDRKP